MPVSLEHTGRHIFSMRKANEREKTRIAPRLDV